MSAAQSTILVTGATGFIGAHVVDNLLERGINVKAATRSLSKANLMKSTRQQYSSQLEFIRIADFSEEANLADVMAGVDGIIHVASPFSYDVQDSEKELVLPAIKGVRSVLSAALQQPRIKRVVITSSFASVMNAERKAPPSFTYTEEDWNPLSYEESIDPKTSAVVAYRGSKKFAELEAWNFVRDNKPRFEVTTLCPPMTFGPVKHPVTCVTALNESNSMLWKVASGKELPVARVPFWIDVRDLAQAHVEALLRPDCGNKRYTVAAPEKFSYQLAADIVCEEFDWGPDRVARSEKRQEVDDSYDLDGLKAAKELSLTYRSFRNTVVDLITQAAAME